MHAKAGCTTAIDKIAHARQYNPRITIVLLIVLWNDLLGGTENSAHTVSGTMSH